MQLCKVCNRPLNESQWRKDRSYKSCPKCSVKNGKEHVYYEYPEHFGTTEARVTSTNPDGAQSYCVPCRGEGNVYENGIMCSEL